VAEQLWRDFGKPNRIRKSEHSKAVEKAYQAQADFDDQRRRLGMEIEDEWIGCGKPAVLLLGRPYSLYDMGLNLSIPTKLRDLYGVPVIPMDLVDLRGVDIRSVHPHMFWNYGIKILQAALWSKKHRDIHLIYLSHFKCGPDSYIRHYIEEASRKTFLFLQLDSHANDAGIMTRIEAFLESKKLV
jgi:predicted nucleotide-binding protein (sugar kinase/HSP70/actin superfamily)